MGQYRDGIVSVVHNTNGVVGVGTAFLANIAVGQLFALSASQIPYIVGGVTDDTHFTVTAPYAGADASGQAYSVTQGFTPNLGLPYPERGDINTVAILKRLVQVLDNAISFTYTPVSITTAGQITSTIATGTTPLVVASTTQVANLNASYLAGQTWASPGAIGGTTAAAALFTALGVSGVATLTAAPVLSSLTGYVKANGSTAATASTTIPVGDITGLGSMATQAAAAVAISGGTITGITSIATFAAITTSGDVQIGGNLHVLGTTTTFDSTTVAVVDPLVKYATGNTGDIVDIGFYGQYTASGAKFTGLFRDASDGKYRLFTGLVLEPASTVNTSGTGYAVATLVAALEGDVTGSVSGSSGSCTGSAPAGALTGTTLAAGVTASSLTSLGTLAALSISGQITSTVTPGTAPLVTSSATQVANLNASYLEGYNWGVPKAIGNTAPNTGNFSTLAIAGVEVGGAWSAQPFNSTDFTATSSTWTVTSGNVVTFAFTLIGKTMKVSVFLSGTTVGAGAGINLIIKIPAGKTAAKRMCQGIGVKDNGTTRTGWLEVKAGDNHIYVYSSGGSWLASSGATDVMGQIEFEIT